MSSPTRITGLVSGLDVDSLVKSLMTAKKIPIDQMKQKETQMEWKRDAYRDTNTLLSQLKDASLQMKLTSNTNRKTATTDNVNAVSATGTSTAVNGQYTLSVNTLATAASLTSAATLGLDATGNLNNATGSTLTVSGSKGTKDITIAANTTISQVVADLNAQSTVTGVKATYDKVADKLYLFSSDTGSTSNISLSESAGGTFLSQTKMPLGAVTNDDVVTATGAKSFTSTSSLIDNQLVGTKKVTVTSGATSVDLIINSSTTIANLQDQLSRSALGSNVNLSLDKSGKVRFESPAGTNLTFSNDMTELGLESTTTSNQNSVLARGTDATVQFNGSPDPITYHSNTFTLNGIQFNIKQPGATVNVTVGTDVDGVFNKIKGFIDTYNDILSKVTTKYNEPHDRSYLPLTDDQKSAMKDTDITKWEDVAKQGLLNGDQMLASAMSNMRQTMYSPVTAMSGQPISTLSDIGIQSFSYQDQGKLTIDEGKLRQAISDNPDAVVQLFTNVGTAGGTDRGLAVKLYDTLKDSISKLGDRAGSSMTLTDQSEMGKQITDMKNKIYEANSKLSTYEQNYYNQFAQLETMMSKAQSQGQWLQNQLGGSNGQ